MAAATPTGPIYDEDAPEPLRPPMAAEEQRAEDPVPCVEGLVLDRYPVTVDRYTEFIDSGGYGDWELWDDDGWHWRVVKDVEVPRFWDEPDWTRFVTGDRPVIGVSWYEARAFCRWGGRRLPTEQEWEAAAQGTDGRTYPWGHDWEDGRVGIRGIGPRCTWPVGFCAGGVGPFGHHDLIGNVWQWTDSLYAPDNPGNIVVRGGSWASRQEHCRTDHRNAYTRDGQWSHVGFRTCRGPTPGPMGEPASRSVDSP